MFSAMIYNFLFLVNDMAHQKLFASLMSGKSLVLQNRDAYVFVGFQCLLERGSTGLKSTGLY